MCERERERETEKERERERERERDRQTDRQTGSEIVKTFGYLSRCPTNYKLCTC